MYDYDYYRQFGFPGGGFPGGGFPGFPGGGQNVDRRLDRIENTLQRHEQRINRLNRRLQRVERQLGYALDTQF
ncbi:hypothetical protein [Calidifontibacillus oryziterrae]|uniref:hypothetical protein n=1 Tax=Calidifontibacillus oryziterrae TaxID=1191699 RepID=UPI0002DFAD70|nr:hypothetical protein [Calidifontibacillus oryziterrae]